MAKKTKTAIDGWKYEKIYNREGVLTKKKDGLEGEYGAEERLNKKWRRYGHGNEGRLHISEVMRYKPDSMIDIGCGYNEFMKEIRSAMKTIRGYKKEDWIGSDVACPGADVIAPAHDLPFEDDQFDMVVSFDCMEHIPEEEVPLCIEEFHRVGQRIYLKIALTQCSTLIDGQPLHACVKPAEWWLDSVREYFPTAHILRISKKNSPWESAIIYADKNEILELEEDSDLVDEQE